MIFKGCVQWRHVCGIQNPRPPDQQYGAKPNNIKTSKKNELTQTAKRVDTFIQQTYQICEDGTAKGIALKRCVKLEVVEICFIAVLY